MTPEWLKKWDKKIVEMAKDAAIRHRLDPDWVYAIVQTESE